MTFTSIATRTFCIAIALCFTHSAYSQEKTTYRGMCDASAAVALGKDHFVVADDESNFLRIYRRGVPTFVGETNLRDLLKPKKDKEVDLEGAAAIGERIYWITSHGRNADAEVKEQRLQFFATKAQPSASFKLETDGRSYTTLLSDLLEADKQWNLGLAVGAQRAPECEGGLNIEGLASTPDGKLLIAFRNPVPDGLAIVVPIENPQALIDGTAKAAKFGKPLRLNLDNRGIRSIELVGSSYLIVAGATNGVEKFALYRWSGKETDRATLLPDAKLSDLRPEALFAIPGTNQIQLLSDDGDLPEEQPCKHLSNPSAKFFRSTIVEVAPFTQNSQKQSAVSKDSP